MTTKPTAAKGKLEPAKRKTIAHVLVEMGTVTREQVRQAQNEKKQGQKLSDTLLALGFITEKQLIKAMERELGIEHVSLFNQPIAKGALKYIPHDFAQKYFVMPMRVTSDTLVVAMHDPMNYAVLDNMALATQLTIKPVIATRDDILHAINKYYVSASVGVQTSRSEDDEEAPANGKLDESVIELFNQILITGVQLKSSDIHIDVEARYIAVRYRIDGQLRLSRKIDKSVHGPLVARIKILASLDITQTRLPQDGRFGMTVGGGQVDLRVACLPTVHGEKIVIRVLDLTDGLRKITSLNFSKDNLAQYTNLLTRPSGLVLLTGPTGSGKSSTLYASVKHLNKENVNIMTIEDPVELELEGVSQIQVSPDTGLTFAVGLRSILRQDPNVIMIGEIRDTETAEIAIRSALTGHLVFSTLHTNSAIDAIPRLIDMGIEPYLVASSIKGIVAQRLVRRICTDCRKARKPTAEEAALFKSRGKTVDAVYQGKGCDACQQSGYRGRFGVHELITIDEKVKRMLLAGATTEALKDSLRESGMQFLIDDGLDKVKAGLTTIAEVMQIAMDE